MSMNSQSSVRLDAHELGKNPVTEKYTVTLDKYECQMVELVVDDWLKVDKARGVWNRTKDPLRLRQAMGAQMAFAKLFNRYTWRGTASTPFMTISSRYG
jgi:hypothetical protein